MKKLITILLIINFQLLISNCYAQSPVDSVASGCALDFNGVSNWVNLGSNVNLSPGTGDFTIELWVSPNAFSAPSVERILFKNNGSPSPYNGYFLMIYNNAFRFGFGDGINSVGLQAPTSFQINTWYHVACVRDRTLGQLRMYINGVLVNTKADLSVNINQSTPLYMARASHFNGEYYNGQLDEVRIWNKALTQTEIQQNMCKKLIGTETGLVGYWRFDDCGGLTATDASGNGNNGTLN